MFKNARQVEFAELVEVMRARGIKPAGVARLLKISKASVSKILDGKQTPREQNLEFLRHLVAQESQPTEPVVYPEQVEQVAPMRDAVWEKLQGLPAEDRRAIESHINYLASMKNKPNADGPIPSEKKLSSLAGAVGMAARNKIVNERGRSRAAAPRRRDDAVPAPAGKTPPPKAH